MSVNVEEKSLPLLNTVIGSKKDSFGLAVIDSNKSTPRPSQTEGPKNDRKHEASTGLRAVYHNGVRIPILQDIENKYRKHDQNSCRFDIVETVRTVIKPGTYTPSMTVPAHAQQNISPEGARTNRMQDFPVEHHIVLSRDNTFHSTRTTKSDYKEKPIWDKMSSYNWSKTPFGEKRDARDVLYKHTYCPETLRLRYRSSTLPHISQDRPWTVSEAEQDRKRMSQSENFTSAGHVTIVPKQPRGTVVRFSEFMRPSTYASNSGSLEVKRVEMKQQSNVYHQFSNVRNVFPLIRQDSRKAKRVERPLKFENSRYKGNNRTTLFKQRGANFFPHMVNRDYSSADTFKEYLDTLQNNMISPRMQSRELQQREGRVSELSPEHDYHNRALQSVVDVNKPNEETKVAPSKQESVSQPTENRSSITIEIKPSWKETAEDQNSVVDAETAANPAAQKQSQSVKTPSLPRPKSEALLSCPTNTPTPVEDDMKVD